MSSKPEEHLDRRDLLIASLATVGASAGLVVDARFADAQMSATPIGPAPSTSSATVYTGDKIQGKKVVSALDVNDLEPGQKHFLYFQGVQMPTGQYTYVSVTVAKGAKPGKRAVLVSGVHGDEMAASFRAAVTLLALRICIDRDHPPGPPIPRALIRGHRGEELGFEPGAGNPPTRLTPKIAGLQKLEPKKLSMVAGRSLLEK